MQKISENTVFFAALIIAFSFSVISAQSSGGVFSITQSVIAGGGQNSSGSVFSLDGTVGQSAAGGSLSGGTTSVISGFWNFSPFAPTAADVSISGRVMTGESGLRNAIVTMIGMNGTTRSVITGTSGYFRFNEVAAGETYIVSVISKRYQFAPQIVSVSEDLTDLNFTALPQ